MTNYPKEYKLDGAYFRVCRNNKWCNICFSDLTKKERDEILENKTTKWYINMIDILVDALRANEEEYINSSYSAWDKEHVNSHNSSWNDSIEYYASIINDIRDNW